MALSKRVALGNGVATNYHRIVSVSPVVNVQTTVEVASYTSRAKREEERSALSEGGPMNVYVETSFHVLPYVDGMTARAAYEWLKANVPALEGASDVLEAGQEPGGARP